MFLTLSGLNEISLKKKQLLFFYLHVVWKKKMQIEHDWTKVPKGSFS